MEVTKSDKLVLVGLIVLLVEVVVVVAVVVYVTLGGGGRVEKLVDSVLVVLTEAVDGS